MFCSAICDAVNCPNGDPRITNTLGSWSASGGGNYCQIEGWITDTLNCDISESVTLHHAFVVVYNTDGMGFGGGFTYSNSSSPLTNEGDSVSYYILIQTGWLGSPSHIVWKGYDNHIFSTTYYSGV